MYIADDERYSKMPYAYCGKSGLKLPKLSLGLWHNFGGTDVYENSRAVLTRAFDLGITHMDLANNYGPPPGSAEENFGRILKSDLMPYRDELVISSKAGYLMWNGPYGDGGSKKYLIASLEQSLKRMGLDYVDIFYSHRFDPETPLYETMDALATIVKQGKALYVGISNYYLPEQTQEAYEILASMGVRCLIHQPRYSMFDRRIENGLLDKLGELGMGCIVFSPLEQGMLTDRYLKGIPTGSRATKSVFLKPEQLTEQRLNVISELNNFALGRGQTLAQMAIAWVLRDKRVTTALIGASSVEQLQSNVDAMKNSEFSNDEIETIEKMLGKDGLKTR